MWAVQFDEYGPPEVLHLAQMECPPAGPGELQLRVAAAGVNPADFKWRSGLLRKMAPLTLPHVVGYDVAGTVTDVGDGVTRFRLGDRVVATVRSGYAEFAIAAEDACALLPDGLDFSQAAALPCPALTGVQLIEDGVRPQEGQTVLITGATGGVGRFAVQAAKALGARVVAAVRPAYFDDARELGATMVISLQDGNDKGLAFDHVADTVGGPDVARLCLQVAPGARIITVSTTPIDPAGLTSPVSFFSYRADGVRLARILDDVARGVINMPIAHRMPFTAAAVAHRLMEQGGVGGKIVLLAAET